LADPAALEETLGISFNDALLLEQALVHSSFVNENPAQVPKSNERLEFLGDAILGLVIAEELYQNTPDASEGEMTNLRAALVRGDTLARVATLEAVIAAIFLDQGFATARKCTLRLFQSELRRAASQGTEANYKSRLQEFIQAGGGETPAYYVTRTEGPDHNRSFTVEVRSGDTILGNGTGRSKKLAETEAARSALERLLSQPPPPCT